jgi:hypothetical protein
LPSLAETLLPKVPGDVLELDEVWAFVYCNAQQRWLWTALCRRTRQIVAFVIGDRSEATCRRLWAAIPVAYGYYHPCGIGSVDATVIFGKLIMRRCPNGHIILWKREAGKHLTKNVGTTPYDSGWVA